MVFEEGKANRANRADVVGRLIEQLRAGLSACDDKAGDPADNTTAWEQFAREQKWQLLAEYVWACAVEQDRPAEVRRALAKYPELGKYLQDVYAGMTASDQTAPETPPELVEELSLVVRSLQAEPLDRRQLERAGQIVGALTEACEEREQEQSVVALLQQVVAEWEAGREEPVVALVADRLHALGQGIAQSRLTVDQTKAVLDHLGHADLVERRIGDAHRSAQEALDRKDFELARKLTDELVDHEKQRDAAVSGADRLLQLTDVTDLNTAIASTGSDSVGKAGVATDTAGAQIRGVADEREKTATVDTSDVTTRKADVDDSATKGGTTAFATEVGDPVANCTKSEADCVEATRDEEAAAPESDPPAKLGDAAGTPNRGTHGDQSVEAAVISAVGAGRLGIAYHLASSETRPSKNAILLSACGHVSELGGPVDSELHIAAADLQDELTANTLNDRETRADYLAFIATGALVPAQLAPGGTVAQLLIDVEEQLHECPSLSALSKVAAEVSLTGVHLPLDALRGAEVTSAEEWSASMVEFHREVDEWLAHEKDSTTPFAGATKVWRRILSDVRRKPANRLGAMFAAMADDDRFDIELVEESASYWQSHGDQEIDQVDRLIRTSASKRIEGRARRVLRKKLAVAVGFAARWRSLVDARPLNAEFHQRQAEKLRSAVSKHADAARQELRSLGGAMHEASSLLLEHYFARFQDGAIATGGTQLADILHGELLFEPRLAVDEWGEPSEKIDRDVLMSVARSDPVTDFSERVRSRFENRDFVGGRLALEYLERNAGVGDDVLEALHFALDQGRAVAERELKDEISHVRDLVDMAYAIGVLPKETSDQLRDQVPTVEETDLDDLRGQSEALERVKTALDDAHEKRRRSVTSRLRRQKEIAPDEHRRVADAIENGAFQVAEDYLDRLEEGLELPNDRGNIETDLDRFFPDFIENYVALNRDNEDVLGHFRAYLAGSVGHPAEGFEWLLQQRARDSAQFMDTWLALQNGGIQTNDLRALMEFVGFQDVKVSRRAGGNDTSGLRPVAVMQAKPVADRNVTPLPSFGSLAEGRYRLFVLRDRVSHQAILAAAGEWQAESTPRIVIHCGVVDVGERRLLARAFQSGKHHPTLLLDEALSVYLAMLPKRRLTAFFSCSSAFSFAAPFDPNVARVPPELFYGRESERRRLLATTGDTTHLLYGGRRVGKTALLRNIEAEVSEDGPDVRIYLDLKRLGIGVDRPSAELWSCIGSELVRRGIVERGTSRVGTIEERLRSWLAGDTERRVLLLLDEADEFLDAERQYDNPRERYPVMSRMKSLMDETRRRFKIVLAGLHDVQRATRDPNTPLAQLDTPVSIGPMLPETDGAVASDLIRRPLHALGYRFESDESIVRIAAETNYFPALIQQFCKELLNELRREGTEDGPPYLIKPEVVDRVFASPATRERIRDLFRWTIELDERYRFLTFLVALEGFEDYESRREGLTVHEIRTKALEHWPAGFLSDDSYEMFEVLLDEMVGLGIFRVVAREDERQAYAVRTRNLRVLLGNDEQIQRRYADIRRTRPAPVFSQAQYRKDVGRFEVSSLTASQENRLLAGGAGVGLVFGTCLSGIQRVRESIKAVREIGGRTAIVHDSDLSSVRDYLGELRRTREPGIHVVVTRMEAEFDVDVVSFARDRVRTTDATRRIILPVFVGGPQAAWGWLTGDATGDPIVRDIWLSGCARDFARGWLHQRESPAYTELEQQDGYAGSLWPAIIEMGARSSLKSIDAAVEAALVDEILSDIVSLGKELDPIRVLAVYDDTLTSEDILEIAPDAGYDLSADDVATSLDWAGRLGVVHVGESGYRVDPAYVQALAR